MSKYHIIGRQPLQGEISVKGAKNMALKVLPATLLCNNSSEIRQVPEIEDVSRILELFEDLGIGVESKGNGILEIDPKTLNHSELKEPLVRRIRAAVMLIAPLLHRFGEVYLPHPGGCALGKRPIDIFIDGFKAFGAEIYEDELGYRFKCKKLKGTHFFFPVISHTATESLIMAAVLAEGKTVLENSACEPEIIALANFLNSCGAKIEGAGTHTITIEGASELTGGTCDIIPDRIEAGSFAILGAITGNNIKVTNCEPSHLKSLWGLFDKIGIQYNLGKNYVEILKQDTSAYKAVNIRTHEYPGFVTDLQAPMTLLLTQANGTSLVHEAIFESRLYYTDLLNRMGAKIILCDPHRAIVSGPTPLSGRKVISPDLRAGITMVLAGLIAEGETTIDNVYQVERGYANLIERLTSLGAKITRED